jgi:hypothetical protein
LENLPEGSLFLPLNEIEGWHVYTGASAAAQEGADEGKEGVEGVLRGEGEGEVEGEVVISTANERDGYEGTDFLTDDYVKLKLTQLSSRQLAWKAGLRGKFTGKSNEELIDLALSAYRANPFPLPGDDDEDKQKSSVI